MTAKEAVKEQTGLKIEVPKKYRVLIFNDDFTPMDFVVAVLIQIFDKKQAEAEQLMLQVHKSDFAVVGTYPRDLAQTKAYSATRWAREEGFPLKVEAVSE